MVVRSPNGSDASITFLPVIQSQLNKNKNKSKNENEKLKKLLTGLNRPQQVKNNFLKKISTDLACFSMQDSGLECRVFMCMQDTGMFGLSCQAISQENIDDITSVIRGEASESMPSEALADMRSRV